MNSFTSPFLEIIAKHVAFIASSVLAVLILLTVYDEDVITVEHMITIITGLGAVIAMSRAFIADVIPQKYTQSELYTQILEHVHYVPSGYAPYSVSARSFVATLFPYRICSLAESLISPIATPLILAFCVPSRAEQIVDFFRVCTKEVPGTGDVCNFAMFNIRDQGNDHWKPAVAAAVTNRDSSGSGSSGGGGGDVCQKPRQERDVRADDAAFQKGIHNLVCTEDGKLELSLIHFKLTNPKWHPAEQAQSHFIDFVTKESIREIIDEEEEVRPPRAARGGIQRDDESFPTSSSGMDDSQHHHHPLSHRFKRPVSPPKSQSQHRHQTSSASSMHRSSFHLQSLAALPPHDQEMEVNEILNRERNRVLNSIHSNRSLNNSRLDSNLCMTLSTLFLHEYATTSGHGARDEVPHPDSSHHPQGLPSQETGGHVSSSTPQQTPLLQQQGAEQQPLRRSTFQ